MDNNIRIAQERDYEWIAAIQRACGLPQIKPGSASWVLENKAFAIWHIACDLCELLSIAVAAPEQGKGLATNLMSYCHAELVKKGVSSFFLEVRESNCVAVSLYKKQKYEKISVRKAYYANGENALVMRATAE